MTSPLRDQKGDPRTARSLPHRRLVLRRTFSDGVIRYFEEITQQRGDWERRVRPFVNYSTHFLKSVVRPNSRVLVIGCPSLDFLKNLSPAYGVGTHLSKHLIGRLKEECSEPNLEFFAGSPEDFSFDEKFDYIILAHQTEFSQDIFALIECVSQFMDEHSILVVSRTNPIWQPLTKLAGKVGLRIPDYTRSFFSDDMIRGSLQAKGFDIQGEFMREILPVEIPFLTTWVNTYVGRLPLINRLAFVKYTFAKFHPFRPESELTCSVIIPCYNEEGNVRECAERVPNMGGGTEVIIVDDGSKDRTVEIGRQLEKEHSNVRCIVCEKNGGKGKAVMRGFAAAKGDVLFILDADMTVPPEELKDFFDAVACGAADFVSGTRFVYPMEEKAMRISNYLGNILFSRLVQVIVGTKCTDTLCGTKVMRHEDYRDMKLEESSWGDFDFIFHAAKRKLRTLEIPVHYKSRVAGESKMKAFSAGFRFLSYCLRNWRHIP